MFPQTLDPIGGSLALSALLAATPLVLLFVLLGIFRFKAYRASLIGLAASVLLAVVGWGMPVGQALSATAEGAFYGAFPILWILVNALWIYRLSVVTGWFDVLGDKIRAISDDQRVLAILIAFCFGALLESLAGFGAPVAISAAMLMAAGMKPLKAATVSLLANTAPVAFGAMGTPVITLAGVTDIDLHLLSQMTGRQTPFIALVVPLILVFMVDGRRGVRQTWPVALVAGATFGLAQFVTANYLTVEITDIIAAIATVVVVLAMVRIWKPANPLTPAPADSASDGIDTDGAGGTEGGTPAGPAGPTGGSGVAAPEKTTPARTGSTWNAVAPYAIIIAIFSLSQIPAVKAWLTEYGSVSFGWPGLDIVNASGDEVAATTFKLDHLKATGTLLLLSGLITMAAYRISPAKAVKAYKDTLVQLKFTIVTVLAVLALAFVMNLSGQTASLGFALASTGGLFVLLSPVIGWIGVAITGSDTSSNSLFGLLQVTAANQTGLSPVLMAATNSSAGVMGKMLSPQNLAVAAAAVGMAGQEGEIFRRLIWWSLGLLALFTLLVVLQASVLSWMVPA
ncbi:L-lactate permease [Pseudonocardia nematodicida]|uniref:L-lactate permease n=1 Tax=Pseudonocardia nematodicida TaxID=1206997 RepID=A0ABV1KAN7_9PSEU